ncbi:hypothetical protein CcaverHIS631_0105450 [Cutaneotrichosporon cavernicola]|nr:hypothetical protein CcaverHIS631_0105450 [Cutaneotrichosporon cavernicola]
MDINGDHPLPSSVTLPVISVAESSSPSKRAPPPLNLKENLPSIGEIFDGVDVTTPYTPYTRLAQNFERNPPLRSPLRSPLGLSVPSLAIQPATPVVGESAAGTDAATYIPPEQLVNNDFEIDPALTEASTPLNTPPDASQPFGLPITLAKNMMRHMRHEKTSSERHVLHDTSPARSYSTRSPGTSPYRHMNNRWDTHSISPAQISRSPSPGPVRYESDDESAGYMEMDTAPLNHLAWQQPIQLTQSSSTLPRDGYFAPHYHQTAQYSSTVVTQGILGLNDNYYPTPDLTPSWSRVATPLPVPVPTTPPGQIRATLAPHAHSAPTMPGYANPSPYTSPGAELASSLENTVPPGATFDQWSCPNPASMYNDNLQAGSWREDRYRLATPAYSEMSVDTSPSPARTNLPYVPGEYRHSFARSQSPSPGPSNIPMGSGPVRPGTVHGRARHNPVARKRSATGVALDQFSQLTVDLVYPCYHNAIRQWSPIVLDLKNPVPHDYRDKRGFWDDECFWTWDCTVKVHTRCIRICAQCHTARPGAKTWRRSHIQQETSLCNKCGIYEHTHRQPRPPKPGDIEKAYNPALRIETFNFMLTSRTRGSKKERSPSPPLKFKPNPVFGGVVQRRRDTDVKPFSGAQRTRRDRGSDNDEHRPGG